MILAIKIVAGALIGLVCKVICDRLELFILTKRQLTCGHSKIEDYILYIVMAAYGATVMWRTPISPETIYMFIILIICELIAVIDLHHRIIPNKLLLIMLLSGLIFGVPSLFGVKGFPEFSVLYSVIGLITGFVIFTVPAFTGKNVGAGDIKLAATIGFCLGAIGLLYTIILMGICVLGYSVMQRRMPVLSMIHSMIPMGPFISLAMLIVINFI